MSIYDTTNGQCTAGAMIRGEAYRCDLATDHNGWAHQHGAQELLWQDNVAWEPSSSEGER